MTVVTNYSDLTSGMKALLLCTDPSQEQCIGYGQDQSLSALCRRGLATRVDIAGHYRLTDRGAAAAAQLRRDASAKTSESADLYTAISRTVPAFTDVARYVAQLRRWAAAPVTDDLDRGRVSAFTMVADQLERDVLRDLAPLLAPEALRRDAERQSIEPTTEGG